MNLVPFRAVKTILALLFVASIASASYLVASKLSTTAGLTPNAPSSNPQAKETNEAGGGSTVSKKNNKTTTNGETQEEKDLRADKREQRQSLKATPKATPTQRVSVGGGRPILKPARPDPTESSLPPSPAATPKPVTTPAPDSGLFGSQASYIKDQTPEACGDNLGGRSGTYCSGGKRFLVGGGTGQYAATGKAAGEYAAQHSGGLTNLSTREMVNQAGLAVEYTNCGINATCLASVAKRAETKVLQQNLILREVDQQAIHTARTNQIKNNLILSSADPLTIRVELASQGLTNAEITTATTRIQSQQDALKNYMDLSIPDSVIAENACGKDKLCQKEFKREDFLLDAGFSQEMLPGFQNTLHQAKVDNVTIKVVTNKYLTKTDQELAKDYCKNSTSKSSCEASFKPEMVLTNIGMDQNSDTYKQLVQQKKDQKLATIYADPTKSSSDMAVAAGFCRAGETDCLRNFTRDDVLNQIKNEAIRQDAANKRFLALNNLIPKVIPSFNKGEQVPGVNTNVKNEIVLLNEKIEKARAAWTIDTKLNQPGQDLTKLYGDNVTADRAFALEFGQLMTSDPSIVDKYAKVYEQKNYQALANATQLYKISAGSEFNSVVKAQIQDQNLKADIAGLFQDGRTVTWANTSEAYQEMARQKACQTDAGLSDICRLALNPPKGGPKSPISPQQVENYKNALDQLNTIISRDSQRYLGLVHDDVVVKNNPISTAFSSIATTDNPLVDQKLVAAAQESAITTINPYAGTRFAPSVSKQDVMQDPKYQELANQYVSRRLVEETYTRGAGITAGVATAIAATAACGGNLICGAVAGLAAAASNFVPILGESTASEIAEEQQSIKNFIGGEDSWFSQHIMTADTAASLIQATYSNQGAACNTADGIKIGASCTTKNNSFAAYDAIATTIQQYNQGAGATLQDITYNQDLQSQIALQPFLNQQFDALQAENQTQAYINLAVAPVMGVVSAGVGQNIARLAYAGEALTTSQVIGNTLLNQGASLGNSLIGAVQADYQFQSTVGFVDTPAEIDLALCERQNGLGASACSGKANLVVAQNTQAAHDNMLMAIVSDQLIDKAITFGSYTANKVVSATTDLAVRKQSTDLPPGVDGVIDPDTGEFTPMKTNYGFVDDPLLANSPITNPAYLLPAPAHTSVDSVFIANAPKEAQMILAAAEASAKAPTAAAAEPRTTPVTDNTASIPPPRTPVAADQTPRTAADILGIPQDVLTLLDSTLNPNQRQALFESTIRFNEPNLVVNEIDPNTGSVLYTKISGTDPNAHIELIGNPNRPDTLLIADAQAKGVNVKNKTIKQIQAELNAKGQGSIDFLNQSELVSGHKEIAQILPKTTPEEIITQLKTPKGQDTIDHINSDTYKVKDGLFDQVSRLFDNSLENQIITEAKIKGVNVKGLTLKQVMQEIRIKQNAIDVNNTKVRLTNEQIVESTKLVPERILDILLENHRTNPGSDINSIKIKDGSIWSSKILDDSYSGWQKISQEIDALGVKNNLSAAQIKEVKSQAKRFLASETKSSITANNSDFVPSPKTTSDEYVSVTYADLGKNRDQSISNMRDFLQKRFVGEFNQSVNSLNEMLSASQLRMTDGTPINTTSGNISPIGNAKEVVWFDVSKKLSEPITFNIKDGNITSVYPGGKDVLAGVFNTELVGLVPTEVMNSPDTVPIIEQVDPTDSRAMTMELAKKKITLSGRVLTNGDIAPLDTTVRPPRNISLEEARIFSGMKSESATSMDALLASLPENLRQQLSQPGDQSVEYKINKTTSVTINKTNQVANDVAGYSLFSTGFEAETDPNLRANLKSGGNDLVSELQKRFGSQLKNSYESAGDGIRSFTTEDVTVEQLKNLVDSSGTFERVLADAMAGKLTPNSKLAADNILSKYGDQVFTKVGMATGDTILRLSKGNRASNLEVSSTVDVDHYLDNVKKYKAAQKAAGTPDNHLIAGVSEDIYNKFTPEQLKRVNLEKIEIDNLGGEPAYFLRSTDTSVDTIFATPDLAATPPRTPVAADQPSRTAAEIPGRTSVDSSPTIPSPRVAQTGLPSEVGNRSSRNPVLDQNTLLNSDEIPNLGDNNTIRDQLPNQPPMDKRQKEIFLIENNFSQSLDEMTNKPSIESYEIWKKLGATDQEIITEFPQMTRVISIYYPERILTLLGAGEFSGYAQFVKDNPELPEKFLNSVWTRGQINMLTQGMDTVDFSASPEFRKKVDDLVAKISQNNNDINNDIFQDINLQDLYNPTPRNTSTKSVKELVKDYFVNSEAVHSIKKAMLPANELRETIVSSTIKFTKETWAKVSKASPTEQGGGLTLRITDPASLRAVIVDSTQQLAARIKTIVSDTISSPALTSTVARLKSLGQDLSARFSEIFSPKLSTDSLPRSLHPVIKDNAEMILNPSKNKQFSDVLIDESIGGNAGANYGAVNAHVDKNGVIVSFGNIQDLPSSIRQRIDNKELTPITIQVKVFKDNTGSPDYIIRYDSDTDPHIIELLKGLDKELNSSTSNSVSIDEDPITVVKPPERPIDPATLKSPTKTKQTIDDIFKQNDNPIVYDTKGNAYFIQSEIAEGGTGTVYQAKRSMDEPAVALKVPSRVETEEMVISEYSYLQKMRKALTDAGRPDLLKHIIEPIDTINLTVGSKTAEGFLMEYLPGPRLIDAIRNNTDTLSPQDIKDFREIAQIFDRAGISFIDVYPHNIAKNSKGDWVLYDPLNPETLDPSVPPVRQVTDDGFTQLPSYIEPSDNVYFSDIANGLVYELKTNNAEAFEYMFKSFRLEAKAGGPPISSPATSLTRKNFRTTIIDTANQLTKRIKIITSDTFARLNPRQSPKSPSAAPTSNSVAKGIISSASPDPTNPLNQTSIGNIPTKGTVEINALHPHEQNVKRSSLDFFTNRLKNMLGYDPVKVTVFNNQMYTYDGTNRIVANLQQGASEIDYVFTSFDKLTDIDQATVRLASGETIQTLSGQMFRKAPDSYSKFITNPAQPSTTPISNTLLTGINFGSTMRVAFASLLGAVAAAIGFGSLAAIFSSLASQPVLTANVIPPTPTPTAIISQAPTIIPTDTPPPTPIPTRVPRRSYGKSDKIYPNNPNLNLDGHGYLLSLSSFDPNSTDSTIQHIRETAFLAELIQNYPGEKNNLNPGAVASFNTYMIENIKASEFSSLLDKSFDTGRWNSNTNSNIVYNFENYYEPDLLGITSGLNGETVQCLPWATVIGAFVNREPGLPPPSPDFGSTGALFPNGALANEGFANTIDQYHNPDPSQIQKNDIYITNNGLHTGLILDTYQVDNEKYYIITEANSTKEALTPDGSPKSLGNPYIYIVDQNGFDQLIGFQGTTIIRNKGQITIPSKSGDQIPLDIQDAINQIP